MSGCENHSHDDDHHHDHHHDLFGEAGEIPAVFSNTFVADFDRNVTGEELCVRLADWLEALTLWAAGNQCFVGHIKVFAESGEAFRILLSTTGKEINVRNPKQNTDAAVRQITAAVTAIVFGTDEKSLERTVTDRWDQMVKMG